MKKSLILLSVGLSAILSISCNESTAKATEKTPENGAQFKKGEGISLTEEMKTAIGFTIAEVSQVEIPSTLHLDFTATQVHQARALTASSSPIKPGMEITLNSIQGTVESVEKNPFGLGELEVTVATTAPLSLGYTLQGRLEIPSSGAVPAVPASAVLKTAEGSFVYTVNGSFYVRSPVKTGASNDKYVQITDGLYPGDQIVTTPVMSLWMAELQVLRGGKACTCGH